jgi:multidrug resistance efflux pump
MQTNQTNRPAQLDGPLPPIPTPISAVWREFRIRVVPGLVFAMVVASVWLIWHYIGKGSGIAGVGEGVRSMVASPALGTLSHLYVEPFQWVEAGDPVAVIVPVDPRARLDLLQSELQIARLRVEPSIPDQNALSFERVRVEWLRLKQELAMAQVNLQRAEAFLKRNEALVKENLVSQDAYELSLRDRDLYQAEITAKTPAIAEIEERLNQLRGVGEPQSPGTNQPMLDIIARLDARLAAVQTNWGPMTLLAPISGMVHLVYRQANENVVEGEPLITINSSRSDRIVAYMRQPYPIDPEIGLSVEVVTRTRKKQRFKSKITEVGAQVEMITNALAFVRQELLIDSGLPVVVDVPPDVHIRPGEIVDVIVNPISTQLKRFGDVRETRDISMAGDTR